MQTEKQLSTRHWNTLHGFQPLDDKGEIAIGLIFSPYTWFRDKEYRRINDNDISQVKRICGSETLELGDFIGRDYISIHKREKHLIPDIVYQINEVGFNVKLQTSLRPLYTAKDKIMVSVENSEKLAVKSFNSLVEHYMDLYKENRQKATPRALESFDSDTGGWTARCPYLWKTEDGKRLARMYDSYEPRDDFFKWKSFGKNEPIFRELDYPIRGEQQETNIEEEFVIVQRGASGPHATGAYADVEEVDDCMICMDKKPSTMVLPCMHSVVCSDCSRGLQNTNDRRTCVRCRCEITDVLYEN